jgi:hypothetical protein
LPVDDWYTPTLIKSVVYNGDSTLKFVLDTTMARRFLNADLDSATVANDTLFTKYFKGFYVTCEDIVGNDGVMYFLDYSSNRTRLKLCYHNPDTLGIKAYPFTIKTSYSIRFNHFIHDYDLADPAYKIQHLDDTTTRDSVFYIESIGGVRGLIKLDGIEQWAQKMPIAIHRAEMRLELEDYPSAVSKDSLLSYLYYYVEDNDDGFVYTEDQKVALATSAAIYAKYSKVKKYYTINLTKHLQALLTGDVTKKSLYILPHVNSSVTAGRAVLKSGSNRNRIKVVITYSML